MVEILLTEAKNPQKFLQLSPEEQKKNSVTLILENNEDSGFFTNPKNQDINMNAGAVWFDQEFTMSKKKFDTVFSDICKKTELERFHKSVDELGQFVNDFCSELNPINPSSFSDHYTQFLVKKIDPNKLDIIATIPLSFHANPKENLPQEWLDVLQSIKSNESHLDSTIKHNPFLQLSKLNQKRYHKLCQTLDAQGVPRGSELWNKKTAKFDDGQMQKLPHTLLGKTLGIHAQEDTVQFVGFLKTNEFVKVPKK